MTELAAGSAATAAGRATPVFPKPLLRNLAVDAALPWLVVQVLQQVWHVPSVSAFAVAAFFPAASIAGNWVRRRRLDMIGVAVLLTLLGGIAVAVATDDVRFAVVKGAPGFGLFGIACLLSLPRRRPLMFFVSRQFTAGDDPRKAAAWTARLDNPGFRRAMRRLTVVWGVACLAEAALGVTAALVLAPTTALVVEPVLGIGTVAGLLTWTLAFSRRREAQATA